MNIEKSNLQGRLIELFQHKPEALRFVKEFFEYCHEIDDYVDGDCEQTHENFLAILAKACKLYSCPYYAANHSVLYPIVISITNSYADSVNYEDSKFDKWKHQYADVLRSAGNDMLLAVIQHEFGYKEMREISPWVRAESYYQHHDIQGNPV